jgi:hypothetical protein
MPDSQRRPRAAVCLIILAFGSSIAEEPDVIEWSPDRPLTWGDFNGPVPPGTADQRVAATAGALAWSFEYSIQWSRNSCRFRIDNITTHAHFHRDESWVRSGHKTDRVLEHEQGHFDILQLYKNQLHAKTREFLGTERPCQGRTERSATRSTTSEIDRIVGSVYDEVWNEYRGHQETYDRETGHGTNAREQSNWMAELENRLQAEHGH